MFQDEFITKQELREWANCPRRTFTRWIRLQQPALTAMGIGPRCRKLPPSAAAFLCRQLNIDLEKRKFIKVKPNAPQ